MKTTEPDAIQMAPESQKYLQPSELCDFDRHPDVGAKARALTEDCHGQEQKFQLVFDFVSELPYGLEDWDVTASETLAKRWGMCSGKTNLLVAMLRSLGIPARYRVYRIKSEGGLWQWLTQDEELRLRMGAPPVQQDHVDCEVRLDTWMGCDPSRDTSFSQGLDAIGLPLKRKPVVDAMGNVSYLTITSWDDWARERQDRRRFQEDRSYIFTRANERLRKLRTLVKSRTVQKVPESGL